MRDQVNEVLRQTTERVTAAFANFLPGLLAFLIIFMLTVIVAFVLRAIIRRALFRIDFDGRLGQWGFSAVNDWSPARSPTLLLAQTSFLTVLLIGILIGVSALDSRLTSQLIVELFNYLPHVAAAILILVVGSVLSRFLARGVLISAVNMHIHSARLLSLGVKWLVIVLTVAMALDHLKIGGTVVQISFGILFGGIVLALALAVGLGSKDMVRQSWARQTDRTEREAEEQFHHL
jgi:Conserved TM helix